MTNRNELARRLAELDNTHVQRAIALLWYYRHSQDFEERTASELANDLHDEGFPKPNVTRLHNDLRRSSYVINGRRARSFQLDVRRINELDQLYAPLVNIPLVEVEDRVIPSEWVRGTRSYLERLVLQINGTYEYGFYDASAVLARRLMESLIIEIYIHQGRHGHIQSNGFFLALDDLIRRITTDPNIVLSRSSPTTMREIKDIGDVAAHNRTYMTRKDDIDDVRRGYRRMVRELLQIAGITP